MSRTIQRRKWSNKRSHGQTLRYPTQTVLLDLDGTLVDGSYSAFHVEAIPGAKGTIRYLRRRGYRVVLYSMGDRSSRLERLRQAGIPQRWFDAIYAVSCKDPETLERITSNHPGPFVMVGDSWVHDVAPALGRADAVIWVKGQRVPGVLGTPADLEKYPVTVIPTIADLRRTFDAALVRRYDKRAWLDYWQREFRRTKEIVVADQFKLSLDDVRIVGHGDAGTLAMRARTLADQVHALWREVVAIDGGVHVAHDLDDAECALLAAADTLDDLSDLEWAGA